MQVLQTKIEYIDKLTGDVYLRSYGIKDDIVALNSRFPWMAHSSKTDVHSFKNQPVILTPNLDHVINTDSFEAWDKDSRNPNIAIGNIEEIVENQNTKAFDFIWKVNDKRVAIAIKDGLLPKYVSPAIWSENFDVDGKGIVHYKDYRGVHLAIVKKPAFDENISFISDNVCIGGSRCKQELAAVASFSKEITNNTFDFTEYDPYTILQKNFSVNMIEKEKPSSNMPDGEEKKVVPYEEYLKQSKEIEKINAKLQEAEKLKQEAIDNNSKIQTQLTEKSEALDKRIEQDKRAEFGEYLKVIFDNDETKVKEKVDWAIGKEFEKKDLEDLYGHIYEQKQKASEEQNNANPDTSQSPSLSNSPASPSGVDTKAGIGSGIVKEYRESADVAMNLVNQRRRFP